MPRPRRNPLVHTIAIAALLGACRDTSTAVSKAPAEAVPLAFEHNAAEFDFGKPNSFCAARDVRCVHGGWGARTDGAPGRVRGYDRRL